MTIPIHIIEAAVADYVAGKSLRHAAAGRCDRETLRARLIDRDIPLRPMGRSNHMIYHAQQ